jgi:aminobenzoyl-glutamate transport protein
MPQPAPPQQEPAPGADPGPRSRLLDWIERTGNRLPDPATLFVLATLVVLLLSALAAAARWSVVKVVAGAQGPQAVAVEAVNLLSADGLWWLASHLVSNFVAFPPLGIVLVGMLGIGVAERSGLIGALLRRAMGGLAGRGLTPAVVLLGILSSVALDAGYVVLPPLAAALYLAAGRPPLAGIAAVFAGVSAGFGANLVITAVDPLLAGFTEAGARVIDPAYRVAVTANWFFAIASTVLLTLVGWAVTARLIEPRLAGTAVPPSETAPALTEDERRGLRAALLALAAVLFLVLLATLLPGAPLHGTGERFPRWVEATVPLLFLLFVVPGIAYGLAAGTLRSDRDVAHLMGETMAALGPYIVLAFFAAQFVEAFRHSNLGEMLAVAGGGLLVELALPAGVLMVAFILLTLLANLFIGSMSAKYAFFAPIFVPMLMQAGISPELTQAAYRVGDSVSNIITPLNPYLIIILALIRRYAPGAGLGTLVALMLPYTVAFALVWSALLLAWLALGWPLGPGGPLTYE